MKRIVFLATYPPRLCGIATFTQDLSQALLKLDPQNIDVKIAALANYGQDFNYPKEVKYKINAQEVSDYVKTAQAINADSEVEFVSIQHEFKIFGSRTGENLFPFLDALKKPVITTLHSIPNKPEDEIKDSLRRVIEKSDKVVVMAEKAVSILKTDYEIADTKKIFVIPHGIHNLPFVSQLDMKKKLGYEGRDLLVSFGFLRSGEKKRSSGRGYEDVLEALPAIIKKIPKVLYLILGDTHPVVFQKEGDKYYNFLLKKVRELGLQRHVKFVKRYLPLAELFQYLQAADIYICSNLNPAQITSGTLVYALGAGRAVIATPFEHAKEIVSPEHGGLLVKFAAPKLIANQVIKILSESEFKIQLEKNAYAFTRSMTWDKIAQEYFKVMF